MRFILKKLLFIFNPYAETGKIGNALVLDQFAKASHDVTAYPTQSQGDGKREVLEDGAAYDSIVIAGGGGMFHELVDAGYTEILNEVPTNDISQSRPFL